MTRDFTNVGIAQATIAALVDNSGGATADGTIGAVTAPTALVDNGGGTADGTVAAMTAAAAITDSSTGVDPGNNIIAAITNPDLSGWNGSTDPTAAQATAIGAAFTAIKAAIAQLAAKMNTNSTAIGAVKDNFKELTTVQAQNRTAIVALTDATKELSTFSNAILTDLKSGGEIASS